MKITIGTRGSKLARWQSSWVISELERLHPDLEVETKIISTIGDQVQDVPLAQIGGSGLFTKAIEEALLAEEIDLAVHSMKDVATEMDERLKIGVVSLRHSPEDALVCKSGHTVQNLPNGATVATSSLRRRSQLWNLRPDLNIVDMRGNLDTRLRKLNENADIDAVIVARAGLERLGYGEMITQVIGPEVVLSAVGQGALAIQIRTADERTAGLIAPLNHTESEMAVRAERAFLRKLQGGCQVPIGALATIVDGQIELDGCVASLDGGRFFRGIETGELADPEAIGEKLAEELLSQGADVVLEEIRRSLP